MAIKLIRQDGDPILRKKSKEIKKIDKRIERIATDLVDTLENNGSGVGLSGPQIGYLKRIILVYFKADEDSELDTGGPIIAINPVITKTEGENTGSEGCLSFPDIYRNVTRPEKVEVTYTTLDGEEVTESYEGMIARCFCHEVDHLDGIVFLDLAEE